MRVSHPLLGVLAVLICAPTIGYHAAAAAAAAPSISIRRITTMGQAVLTGDLNGDHRVDVVTHEISATFTSQIITQLGTGTGSFNAPIKSGVFGNALALADFNKDGRLDLMIHPRDEGVLGSLAVMIGRGDGTFMPPQRITANETLLITAALAADVDGDGNLDMVVAVSGDNDVDIVQVYPGRGDGTFGEPTQVTIPGISADPLGVAVGDLNGDKRADIVVASHDAHLVSVFLNQGAFNFTASDIHLDRQANDVAIADVNRDGKPDLLVAATHDGADDLFAVDGAVAVLTGRGDGTFAAPVFYDTWRGANRIVTGDFNRDGILDVATANRSAKLAEDFCGLLWDTVSILPGSTAGTFGPASSFSLGDQSRINDTRYRSSARSLVAADVNGDGQPDLVASEGAILLNQAPDTNWPPKVTAAASAPSSSHTIALSATASDVDQDALSYTWTDSGGQAIEPTATPCLYTATDSAVHTFTVTVDDHHGHTASSSVTVDFGGATSPTVSVTKPAAGETVAAGQPYTITWTATPSGNGATLTNFGIFFSSDDGAHWTGIQECANTPGTARSCVWNSPGPVTTTARIQVIANDSHAGSAFANSGRFTIASPGTGGALANGWSHADVGAVGAAGSATFDGFVLDGEGLTVSGSGADIWGAADEFHYAWTGMTGDFSIEAQVESVQNVNVWTKAGLMVRARPTEAQSAHASIFVTPGKGVVFQRRAVEGGASVSNQGPVVAAPIWLRLVRAGDVLTAYYKQQLTDTWQSLGQQALTGFGSTVSVGLAVTSHADGTVAKAVFKGVYLAPLPVFSTNRIGGATGSASNDGTIYTVRASGTDIWGTSDSFVFLAAPIGDAEQITVRVRNLANTNAWAKAGVMIRESLAADAAHADFVATPGKGLAFQARPGTGLASENVLQVSGAAPVWLRLRRSESASTPGQASFLAFYSTDRLLWHVLSKTVTLSMAHDALIGIAVTSHSPGVETLTALDDVRIER